MRKKQNKLRVLSLVVLLLTASVSSSILAQSAEKQIDKLIKRAGDTITAIRAARMQIGATVRDYNQILAGEAEDNRAAYKKLQKSLKKSEKSAAAVGAQAEKMDSAASEYFASWEASLSEFTSDEMRARSEERMKETRQRYDGILQAGREAGEAFRPFVTLLKDQIVFLGHDLNPAAIEDLQDDAERLNSQAKEVFSKIDETKRTAMRYIASLKPD